MFRFFQKSSNSTKWPNSRRFSRIDVIYSSVDPHKQGGQIRINKAVGYILRKDEIPRSPTSSCSRPSTSVRASCLSDRSSFSCQMSFRTFAAIGVEQPAPNSRSPSRFALGVRHPLTADQAPPFEPIRRAGGMDVVGNMSAGS